jgi:hypothetical protein
LEKLHRPELSVIAADVIPPDPRFTLARGTGSPVTEFTTLPSAAQALLGTVWAAAKPAAARMSAIHFIERYSSA